MVKDEKSRGLSVKTCSNRKENGFSVEMTSRDSLDAILFSEDTRGVLIEGNLGELEELGMFEEAVLVVKGAKGKLMVDLKPDDLKKLIQRGEKDE